MYSVISSCIVKAEKTYKVIMLRGQYVKYKDLNLLWMDRQKMVRDSYKDMELM